MARILLSCVAPRLAGQLMNLLTVEGHEVKREKGDAGISALLKANVVFAGGEPDQYLSVLRRVRAVDSTLCFVVVARYPDTSEWLDAIEAGATDYWASPFDLKLARPLVASAIARRACGERTIDRSAREIRLQ